ncbi:uncharacterized protein EKO05_0006921 [Ascochyta rabiei]|uniref:Uncharacterized protein n=1 Tax=Didymella rabiei TaxID=5454 RepID=A0A162Z352_DIDRA|nr:uncharacterized protein EKO05_0006921 [Ascochyta rabiei]KZM20373.1 hypothetical protein ST47_g8508 [Ascochyta rabiei]UPX16524.1 hypothetical protein EKO05_0006921 [Ascochyta rabiei]
MRKPKLSLHAPAEHIISFTSNEGPSDSFLCGQISFSNVPLQCDIQVTLARVGRLKQGKDVNDRAGSKKFIRELGFMGSQKEQKWEQFDYDSAEKLSGCSISPPRTTSDTKPTKCDFRLPVPSYHPATAALPSVEISYAIFATCDLPNGKTLRCRQDLGVIRKNGKPILLEPSRKVSFPESTLVVRASFDAPIMGTKNIVIPTTLQLHGLSLPSTSSMRTNETRWLVPREIKWEFEETAVLITGFPDSTGHVPMSTAQRVLKKRRLAAGAEKLKLKYPFMRPGNTFVRMLQDDNGMEIPFHISAPKTTQLGDSTALSVAGSHILHTVLLSDPSADAELPQKRFAVYLEYKLHMWLRIGEDIFDEASGDLVNRKMDEMAYTVLCPLTMQHAVPAQQGAGLDEAPLPVVPPRYDGVWELPPPGYTTYGCALRGPVREARGSPQP